MQPANPNLRCMNRNSASALAPAALAILFILSAAAIQTAMANPYRYEYQRTGELPTPPDAKKPAITFASPQNNTLISTKNLTINFNVTFPLGNNSVNLERLYFTKSWETGQTILTHDAVSNYNNNRIELFSLNLISLPEGTLWIKVSYLARGGYQQVHNTTEGHLKTIYFMDFRVENSSSFAFTVDTTPPQVTVPNLANTTFSSSNITLTTISDEPLSEITYSLDNQTRQTFSGNCTLTELTAGQHTVTVFAIDEAGNIGAPVQVSFDIAASFPWDLIVVSAVILTVAVGVCVIFMYAKHRRKKGF